MELDREREGRKGKEDERTVSSHLTLGVLKCGTGEGEVVGDSFVCEEERGSEFGALASGSRKGEASKGRKKRILADSVGVAGTWRKEGEERKRSETRREGREGTGRLAVTVRTRRRNGRAGELNTEGSRSGGRVVVRRVVSLELAAGRSEGKKRGGGR